MVKSQLMWSERGVIHDPSLYFLTGVFSCRYVLRFAPTATALITLEQGSENGVPHRCSYDSAYPITIWL